MLSPCRINPNNINKQRKKAKNTNFHNNSHYEPIVKWPQMTSNDLKIPQSTSNENSKKAKTENIITGGFIQENIEINEHYLGKIPKIIVC